MRQSERILRDILEKADIQVNGPRSKDIQIKDQRFWDRVLAEGNLGLGEAYMDGWWDVGRVDEFIRGILAHDPREELRLKPRAWVAALTSRLRNRQSRRRSMRVAERHYNLGNDLFHAFLDSHHQYSCAYFADGDDLEKAQERKMRLIGDKLELHPGEHVLDVGCGFGGLAAFLAEEYDCEVVGVNISREQIREARQCCAGKRVEIVERDYRDMNGKFDKAVSVGMFEHVGERNYRTFMRAVRRVLDGEGLFLLHTIGGNESTRETDPFINRHIFPDGMLPSVAQIGKAVEGLFVMEDWQNLGPHYDRTLMAWNERFQGAWPRLREKYGDRFKRMWEFYLLSCAGAFRSRAIQLWQIVLSAPGRKQPRRAL